MAVDGHLNFDTLINTNGFQKGLKNIGNTLSSLKGTVMNLAGTFGAAFSAAALINFSKSAKELYNVQLEGETKLAIVLGEHLDATKEQIQAAKDYASALQEVGVIGDEVQLAGLQELSTYIANPDSLKRMNVVLNDMLAQQYGLNASAESAVSTTGTGDINTDLSDSTEALADEAEDTADSYEDMAKAAEDANKANNEDLASFDELNVKAKETADSTEDYAENKAEAAAEKAAEEAAEELGTSVEFDVEADTEEAENALTKLIENVKSSLESLFEPIKNHGSSTVKQSLKV